MLLDGEYVLATEDLLEDGTLATFSKLDDGTYAQNPPPVPETQLDADKPDEPKADVLVDAPATPTVPDAPVIEEAPALPPQTHEEAQAAAADRMPELGKRIQRIVAVHGPAALDSIEYMISTLEVNMPPVEKEE